MSDFAFKVLDRILAAYTGGKCQPRLASQLTTLLSRFMTQSRHIFSWHVRVPGCVGAITIYKLNRLRPNSTLLAGPRTSCPTRVGQLVRWVDQLVRELVRGLANFSWTFLGWPTSYFNLDMSRLKQLAGQLLGWVRWVGNLLAKWNLETTRPFHVNGLFNGL